MKVAAKFILAFLWGVLLHQTASVTQRMERGYGEIIGTSLGVVGVAPVSLAVWAELAGVKSDNVRFLAAFFGGFLPVGCGVVAGWFVDTVFKIDRTRKYK